MKGRIDILLATFNGDKYLDPLLSSIEQQTYADWIILARDDCSTDGTPHILANWERRMRGRLVIIDNQSRILGQCLNFAELMQYSRSQYIMTADQDDIWLPSKVEISISALRNLEHMHGSDNPCLVCTDSVVVDESLVVIHNSRWRHSGSRPSGSPSPAQICLDNPVQGCTAIFNRALLELSIPIPKYVRFADWWLALTVSAFGHLSFLKTPTLLWRRHGVNASQHKPFLDAVIINILNILTAHSRVAAVIQESIPLAHEFLSRYEVRLKRSDALAIRALISLNRETFITKRIALVRHSLWYTSFLKNLGLFLFV